jgi:PmbA protein
MKFDILSIHEKSSALHIEGNSLNARKNSEIRRYGFRRFEAGKLFQTSRIGEASEGQLLGESKEWGGPGTPHTFGFAPGHTEKRESAALSPDFLREYEEATKAFIARHPDFVFGGKCTVRNNEISLQSNYGLDLKAAGGVCDWNLHYQRKGSGNMFDGFLGELTSTPDLQGELAREEEYLNAQKKMAKLSSGRMPVLFVSVDDPIYKLIESFSVRRYKEASCLFAGKLGEQLFSPEITLFDQAYDPKLGVHQFFDGEGVVRADDRLVLVKEGRFTSLISDLRFGHKYGMPSTGNGIRAFNSGVNVGLRSLRLQAGQKPWRQILQDLDRCLVAIVGAGGDSNDLGEFSTPVQVGYVFERGEIAGLAPQATVKTTVADYLGKRLIAVSSDGFTQSLPFPCLISEMDVLVN